MKNICILIVCSIVFGCSGMSHIGYRCEGKIKSDLLKNFGPPENVKKSVQGVETWEYTMGGGVKAYTFQDDACIRENSYQR